MRFRLRIPVVFSWTNSQGKRFQGEGHTRDLSVAGAYLYTSTCPPVDLWIQVDVLLPRLQTRVLDAAMRFEARVFRLEHGTDDSAESGFAVVIPSGGGDRFELVRMHGDKKLPQTPEQLQLIYDFCAPVQVSAGPK